MDSWRISGGPIHFIRACRKDTEGCTLLDLAYPFVRTYFVKNNRDKLNEDDLSALLIDLNLIEKIDDKDSNHDELYMCEKFL